MYGKLDSALRSAGDEELAASGPLRQRCLDGCEEDAKRDRRELREIVFEIIPRKVCVDTSAASGIIEELRAFFAFLAREHGLEQADACLRVLGGGAVKKLEAALSDPSKFGMAKSLFMGGREAGFDMSSKEGIEAWMRILESKPLPASLRLPSQGPGPQPVDRSAARAKKNARKAARKAGRKNR